MLVIKLAGWKGDEKAVNLVGTVVAEWDVEKVSTRVAVKEFYLVEK